MRSPFLRISFHESNSDLICLSIRYIRFVLRLFFSPYDDYKDCMSVKQDIQIFYGFTNNFSVPLIR